MKKKSQLVVEAIRKKEKLTRIQALGIYKAFKNANPKVKTEIKKLKGEILNGLSRHDRISGIWFLNVYKKVLEVRSKTVTIEALMEGYNTEDKELISRKLIAHYSNYGIATGAILGSSGGVLGFITAAYATFGEIACLTYFQLSLIYDLSVLYERPLDKANNLELYRVLRSSFGISDKDLSDGKVDELVDKGSKFIEEKLLKNDFQVLQGLLKNLGATILHKAPKNLMAKLIPLVGALSGILVCTTSDYNAMKLLGKRTVKIYSN